MGKSAVRPRHRGDFARFLVIFDATRFLFEFLARAQQAREQYAERVDAKRYRCETVRLTAGELLNPDGTVSQHSANANPASANLYSYTLKGNGEEVWHPRFSYWGFRYVQVEGATRSHSDNGKPELVALEGQFLHDDAPVDGTFVTSKELFNQIHHLIDTAILSNMMSVLTDCPHREKLGWLEQTHLAGTSIMFNYDVLHLYQKIADDIGDAQLANGLVPAIAPEYVAFVDRNGVSTNFRDSPEWGSAAIISPWIAYQFYGDKRLLADHYDEMRRYAEYLTSKSQDHMLAYGLGDWYDIGPSAPGESQLTGKGLTATAVYYQDLKILEQISNLLGKNAEASNYAQQANEVKSAFNRHLFHAETNQYDRGSQTALAMPLALGLVPEGHRQAVLENLVADIRKNNNHVTAGDIGFHYVVRALSDGGRSDVLNDMLSRTDSPSYGYQLSRGATTLTEAWDTNPDSSQNHFMLGHGEEWFYRGLAGIEFDLSRNKEEQIVIRPTPVGDIQSASATYNSVLGSISSSWHVTGNTFTLDVRIPPGASGNVYIPTAHGATLRKADVLPMRLPAFGAAFKKMIRLCVSLDLAITTLKSHDNVSRHSIDRTADHRDGLVDNPVIAGVNTVTTAGLDIEAVIASLPAKRAVIECMPTASVVTFTVATPFGSRNALPRATLPSLKLTSPLAVSAGG